MRVAIDAMGSDLGPSAVVEAVISLRRRTDAPDVTVVGRRDALRDLEALDCVRLVHADDVVEMDDDPGQALNKKSDTSIVRAAHLVKNDEADVLVSAGNTGGVILTCARTFTRLPGVERCALGAVFPTERRRGRRGDPFSLILDAGLTVQVSASDLVAFGVMGACYSAAISRTDRPTVALLSNGAEEKKGPPHVVEAHGMLAELSGDHFEFIGNIEGMDIPKGAADVVITDGFVGNVVLKMLEGVGETMKRLIRYAGKKSLTYQAGLALLSPALKELKSVTDWKQYGGAPILGFDRLCIKAHGRSNARAIENAILVAARAGRENVLAKVADGMRQING